MSFLRGGARTRVERRWAAVTAIVTGIALVVAVVAGLAVLRTETDPLSDERPAILNAAGTAVGTLMTFAPDDPPQARRRTDALLADPLRLEYRARGVDVVLPGAREAGLAMTGTVVGVGLNVGTSEGAAEPEEARVLVFVDQAVFGPAGPPAGTPGGTTPTARWALMRKVDGNWLLADLQPVGDVTR